MNTALLLAVFVAGVLVSGPAWMAHALKQDAERREWIARRRERQLRLQHLEDLDAVQRTLKP